MSGGLAYSTDKSENIKHWFIEGDVLTDNKDISCVPEIGGDLNSL